MSKTTDEKLFAVFRNMIEKLDGGHIFIDDKIGGRFFNSGAAKRKHAEEEFSIDLVRSTYLAPNYGHLKDGTVTYGMLKGTSLGYLHISDFRGDYPSEFAVIVEGFQPGSCVGTS